MIVQFLPIIEEIGGERLDLKRISLSQTEYAPAKFILAADATDEDVFPAKLTTVDFLVINADGAVTYKVNGGTTAVPLDADGLHVLAGTAITALTMSEPSSANVNVKLWAWGA